MTSLNSLTVKNLDVLTNARIGLALLFYLISAFWISACHLAAYGAEFHHARLENHFRNSAPSFDRILFLINAISPETQADYLVDIGALEDNLNLSNEAANGLPAADTSPPFENKQTRQALFDAAEEFYILSLLEAETELLHYALMARDDIAAIGLSLEVINENGSLLPFILDDGFHVLWPKNEFDMNATDEFISEVHGHLWHSVEGPLTIEQSEDISGYLFLSFADYEANFEFSSSHGSSALRFSFDALDITGFSSAIGELFINETSRDTHIHLGIIAQDGLDAALQFKTLPQSDKAIFAGFVTSLPK